MAGSPESIKNAFARWVETWGWETERALYPYREMVYDIGEDREEWPLTKVLGKLWRCTDPLPEDLCERLDLPVGSTYARAAQGILAAGRQRGRYIVPRSGYRVPPE